MSDRELSSLGQLSPAADEVRRACREIALHLRQRLRRHPFMTDAHGR
jgi:hypothetical protein